MMLLAGLGCSLVIELERHLVQIFYDVIILLCLTFAHCCSLCSLSAHPASSQTFSLSTPCYCS